MLNPARSVFEYAPNRMSLGAGLWQSFKREAKLGLRTFLIAWLLLTAALSLYCLLDSPKLDSASDAALMLTFGTLVWAFYTLWPALIVAACRSVYRTLGWGVYLGAALGAAGIATSLLLFSHPLGSLALEVLVSAHLSGPFGVHAGGGAGAGLVLIGLVLAVIGSPASCWALTKLFLLLSLAIALGALPGISLWLALIVRKVVGLTKAGVSH